MSASDADFKVPPPTHMENARSDGALWLRAQMNVLRPRHGHLTFMLAVVKPDGSILAVDADMSDKALLAPVTLDELCDRYAKPALASIRSRYQRYNEPK